MSTPSPASDPDRPVGVIIIGGDMPVGRLGFGAMRLTGPRIWGEPDDPAEARRVLRRAIDFGVNFVDTAESYGLHVSETLIAETLYPYPAGLVIATKGGLDRPASPTAGSGTPGRSACVQPARAVSGASGWSASICTSCTRRTPAWLSRTRWGRSPICRRRGRSGTLVCRTSARTSCAMH